MKYINNIVYSIVFGTVLALFASCADDELVQSNGYRDGERVQLSFTVSVPAAEEVAVTRATETEENGIENLTLLVFSDESDDAVLEQVYTSYDDAGDFSNTGTMTEVDDTHKKKFTATVKASEGDKRIYMLANAGKLLFDDTERFTLEIGTTTESQLQDLQITAMPGNGNPFVMSGYKKCAIPHADLITEDFPLYRCNAKVTVEVAEGVENFTLESFYLCNTQGSGSVVACNVTTLPKAVEDPNEDNMTTDKQWETFIAGMVSQGGVQYTFPTQNALAENKGNTKVFLLIKGSYQDETGATETYYYHADFDNASGRLLNVQANHHYKVTITKVDRIGYRNNVAGCKGAMAAAENITTEIEDIDAGSRNMASDGITEVGVESDELRVMGVDVGTEVTFDVTVNPAVTDASEIQFTWDDASTSWLEEEITAGATTPHTIDDNNDVKQTYSVTTFTLKTKRANRSGERREARLGISCRGVMTYVTVVQEPQFVADGFGSVSLKVKEYERDPNTWAVADTKVVGTYTDYWNFIRNEDSSNPVYGISPESMGGKVRTEGFHAPMSDYQQFVYTFTLPNSAEYQGCSWQVELDEAYADKLLFWNGGSSTVGEGNPGLRPSGTIDASVQQFTFTNNLLELQNNGNITDNAYRYGEDAFRIVVTHPTTADSEEWTETFSYDLYHTGVFNYDDGKSGYRVDNQTTDAGWYYYEVILMGRNYWLDRNLGAKSSAYYVKDVSQGNEPYSPAAAGGLYRIADVPINGNLNIISGDELEKIAPKGFRVPYMSEFQALTSDSRFEQEFVGSYWESRYDTGNPDEGTVYFPKNGMWYRGEGAGTDGTGYYWTQTAALGTSGGEQGYWLQTMQLSGSNASTGRYRIYADGTNNPTGLSVRCVYNSRVVETVHEYECYVKGYTHGFLYNDDGDGHRTYLNSWPGDMISVYDDAALGMYHTFTFSSMVAYDNLKVVFNVVNDENIVEDTYPKDYATAGGLPLKENQPNRFFAQGNADWSATAGN